MDTRYTTRQAAARLGVTIKTVHNLIRRGQLKASKFLRFWVITEEALQELAKDPHYTLRDPD